MRVGSLVSLVQRPGTETKMLYMEPAVHRVEVSGRLSVEELGLVLEVRLSIITSYARVFGPRGSGWINTVYLVEMAEPV